MWHIGVKVWATRTNVDGGGGGDAEELVISK